uniref:Uncharacterized protein n=1 Tax=Myoviridae sp. ctBtT5 TaxID=2825048 RepID=A0A8S5PZM0_9CAUD|nr:MAG TPA: hypothetical protein [Caudoviricetes sp.]DAE11971.1 MAG TPA: hypothetical protein [Myoviridae sp. ctBtT5]DAN58704.1 MAG TPA: hypothetical protein [Caudoviricetes sp.]
MLRDGQQRTVSPSKVCAILTFNLYQCSKYPI